MSMIKNIRRGAFAAALVAATAFTSVSASATALVLNPGPFGTVDFGRNNVIGSFSDVYTFSIPDTGFANGQVTSISLQSFGDINFTPGAVTLDSFVFAVTNNLGGFFDIAVLSDVILGSGLHTLTIAGMSNGTVNRPASYSGTLNVSPVPEPAAWGMMLVGFGLVGAGMRSRRRSMVLA
jgi:hypothetical protein